MTPLELTVLRKQYKLNQAELGARLNPPVSRLTVSNWERGRFAMPADLPQRLAAVDLMTPAGKPDSSQARQDRQALKVYTAMRADTFTHAEILRLWRLDNFTPSPEAQAAIAAAFPDILQPKET
jgi:transcriptional regulator with XRE-family HTH domain